MDKNLGKISCDGVCMCMYVCNVERRGRTTRDAAPEMAGQTEDGGWKMWRPWDSLAPVGSRCPGGMRRATATLVSAHTPSPGLCRAPAPRGCTRTRTGPRQAGSTTPAACGGGDDDDARPGCLSSVPSVQTTRVCVVVARSALRQGGCMRAVATRITDATGSTLHFDRGPAHLQRDSRRPRRCRPLPPPAHPRQKD